MGKFGEVIPTGRKVIRHNMLNCAKNFEFLLSPNFFQRAQKSLDLTFKAPPISHPLAKFHAD